MITLVIFFASTRIDNPDNSNNIPGSTHMESDDDGELPFVPTTITFQDLTYQVDDVNSKKKHQKLTLLNKVNGYAEAGTMTALMGSSGAGKTTLMDVLAMRKTTGDITGLLSYNLITHNNP